MRSIIKSCTRILFLTIAVSLIITMLNQFAILLNNKQHNSDRFQNTTGTNWVLVYFDAELEDYYHDANQAVSLKEEYAELVSSQYFEIHDQPIEIAGFQGPANALYTYDFDGGSTLCYTDYRDGIQYELSSVNAIQISENVQDRFSFQMQSGTVLQTSAFQYRNSEDVHVLLGSDYIGKYQSGDRFTGWYLFRRFGFIVNGILVPNSSIQYGYDRFDLSTMVVIPSFQIVDLPQNSDEQVFFVRHYANKLSGSYEYTSAADATEFKEQCQILSKSKDFSYETNDIALTIEDALLFSPFGLYYFDAYSGLFILITILCTALLILLFEDSFRRRNRSDNDLKRIFFRHFIEFFVSISLASVLFYLICRYLNLYFSISIFASSCLALIAAVISSLIKHYQRKKT